MTSIIMLFVGFVTGCIFCIAIVAITWTIFRESRILAEWDASVRATDGEYPAFDTEGSGVGGVE